MTLWIPGTQPSSISFKEIDLVPDEAVKTNRFTFGLVSLESLNVIEATNRVIFCSIEITQEYDNGATIQAGNSANPNLLLDTGDIKPEERGTYADNFDRDWGGLASRQGFRKVRAL